MGKIGMDQSTSSFTQKGALFSAPGSPWYLIVSQVSQINQDKPDNSNEPIKSQVAPSVPKWTQKKDFKQLIAISGNSSKISKLTIKEKNMYNWSLES